MVIMLPVSESLGTFLWMCLIIQAQSILHRYTPVCWQVWVPLQCRLIKQVSIVVFKGYTIHLQITSFSKKNEQMFAIIC